MLDERTSALLQCVTDGCKGGGYKIFTLDDFREPDGNAMGEGNVDEILERLQDEGFIAVKYAGGGMYCIKTLPYCTEYSKREEERKNEEKGRFSRFEYASFFGSFLGGITGGFLSAATVLLVALLFGR